MLQQLYNSLGLLKSGVTMQRVLDDIRDSVLEGRDDNNARINLIDHQDLKNIQRDFLLKSNERRHANDFTSVKLWIDSMTSACEESPVLYTKMQGSQDPSKVLEEKDFMLIIMTKFQKDMIRKFGVNGKICVDGTHGTNGYDFELHTLLTIDEFGSGCPVAYCISNRCDTAALQEFFIKVREDVGVIQAQVFMTDDAPAYINAWSCVMGPPEHHLLCSWHVDKNWRSQLTKISGGKEKKALVYKALRTLLQVKDCTKMLDLQSNLIRELSEDPETRDFGHYFSQHYAGRPEKWAFCFRIGLGLNTNMHLESMHKTLKHLYLEGKKVKRLDKCINALIKMSRDRIFKRLINITKKTPSSRIVSINQSHAKSGKITQESISLISEGVWEVVSSTNKDILYRVTKTGDVCKNCMLQCRECGICVHMYNCECIDNLIKFNICKHIHAVVKAANQLAGVFVDASLNVPLEVDYEQAEVAQLLDAATSHNVTISSSNDYASKLNHKGELLLGMCSSTVIDHDIFLQLDRMYDKMVNIVQNLKRKHDQDDNTEAQIANPAEPSNKNVEKQRRFTSTKKRRCAREENISLSKPTSNQQRIIIESLLDKSGKSDVINIHTGNDHTYF